MAEDFTEKQKQAYLDNGGNKCPKCKCEGGMNCGVIETDGTQAWRNITCEDCGEEFTDIYKLVDVERYGI
jgi:hypothetical protein